MRTMVKAEKSGQFLVFRTINKEPNSHFRYNGKSDRFYVQKSAIIKSILTDQAVVERDIYSYAELKYFKADKLLRIEFTWITNGDGHGNFKCSVETVWLDYAKMNRWIANGCKGVYKALSVQLNKPDRVIFTDSCQDKLKQVLGQPLLKRKFIKAINRQFLLSNGRVIKFYPDFVDYSFYWAEERGLNGGLILHKDNNNPDNLAGAKYGIHT